FNKFFLTRNPFPYVSVPEDEPRIYFDQVAALERIKGALGSSAETGSSNHIVIVGPYGTGKSHTLKYIASMLNGGQVTGKGKALGVYISHPGTSFVDIYKEIVLRLGYSSMKTMGNS